MKSTRTAGAEVAREAVGSLVRELEGLGIRAAVVWPVAVAAEPEAEAALNPAGGGVSVYDSLSDRRSWGRW